MSAIERYVPEDGEIDRIQRIATNFANSGYFADAKEALQAFVKISAGAEMGLQPFVSMSGIAIIQGKPVVGAGILAGLLDDHPDFDYTVTWAPNSTEPTSCTVTVFKHGIERGESTFSMDDATKAGLAGKDVWKKFQRNMLYARAMSNAVAWYAPSVTRSNGRVFVEGEIEDDEPTPTPAPRRKREQTPASTTAPQHEQVIDVDPVPAVAPDEHASVEPNQAGSLEGDAAAVGADLTPFQQASATIKGLNERQRDAVYDACDRLGIKRTVRGILDRFGDAATSRDKLLAALVEAVTPLPAEGEAEGEVPMGDGAESFQEFLDNDNADLTNTQERLAAAGQYGSGS
ncbi:MAG: hypothetical protein H0X39_00150 [Actinobacteria bacterium]|nr:hypothetical protein [Actinomycetota bacterium]